MPEREFTPRVERRKQPKAGDVVHVISFQPGKGASHGRKISSRAIIEAVYAGTRADLIWEDPGNPLEKGHPKRFHRMSNMVREDAAETIGTWHPVKAVNGLCHHCGRLLSLDASEARTPAETLAPAKVGDVVHIVRYRGGAPGPARFEKLHVEGKILLVHPLGKFVDVQIGDEEHVMHMSPRDESGEMPDSWHLPEKPAVGGKFPRPAA